MRCRSAERCGQGNGVHLRVCAVRAFSARPRALAARSLPHRSGRSSAAHRRPMSAAALTHFFRGTLAPICKTSRAFAAVSAQVFASENHDLASQLASYNFLSEPTENTKAAKRRLVSNLIWRGRRGSNPRPPA